MVAPPAVSREGNDNPDRDSTRYSDSRWPSDPAVHGSHPLSASGHCASRRRPQSARIGDSWDGVDPSAPPCPTTCPATRRHSWMPKTTRTPPSSCRSSASASAGSRTAPSLAMTLFSAATRHVVPVRPGSRDVNTYLQVCGGYSENSSQDLPLVLGNLVHQPRCVVVGNDVGDQVLADHIAVGAE